MPTRTNTYSKSSKGKTGKFFKNNSENFDDLFAISFPASYYILNTGNTRLKLKTWNFAEIPIDILPIEIKQEKEPWKNIQAIKLRYNTEDMHQKKCRLVLENIFMQTQNYYETRIVFRRKPCSSTINTNHLKLGLSWTSNRLCSVRHL